MPQPTINPNKSKVLTLPIMRGCPGVQAECLVSLMARQLSKAVEYGERAMAIFDMDENKEHLRKDREAWSDVELLRAITKDLSASLNLLSSLACEMGTECEQVDRCRE